MLEHKRPCAELLAAQVARKRTLAGVNAVVLEETALMVPQAVVVALVALQVLLAVHVHVPPAERVLLAGGPATLPAQVVGDFVRPQQRRRRPLQLAEVAGGRLGAAVLQQLVLGERRLVFVRLAAHGAHDRVHRQRRLLVVSCRTTG